MPKQQNHIKQISHFQLIIFAPYFAMNEDKCTIFFLTIEIRITDNSALGGGIHRPHSTLGYKLCLLSDYWWMFTFCKKKILSNKITFTVQVYKSIYNLQIYHYIVYSNYFHNNSWFVLGARCQVCGWVFFYIFFVVSTRTMFFYGKTWMHFELHFLGVVKEYSMSIFLLSAKYLADNKAYCLLLIVY